MLSDKLRKTDQRGPWSHSMWKILRSDYLARLLPGGQESHFL